MAVVMDAAIIMLIVGILLWMMLVVGWRGGHDRYGGEDD